MKKLPALIAWPVLILVIILGIYLIAFKKEAEIKFLSFLKNNQQVASQEEVESPYPEVLVTPDKVKGIYLTGYTFSNKKRREQLINLVKATELNSIVIDFKDPSGQLMFTPTSEKLKDWKLSKVSLEREDYKNILSQLQAEQIYTIARITTFQDPTAVKTFPELALKNKDGGQGSGPNRL